LTFELFGTTFTIDSFIREKKFGKKKLIIKINFNKNNLLFVEINVGEEIKLSPSSSNSNIKKIFSRILGKNKEIDKINQYPLLIYKDEKVFVTNNNCDHKILIKLDSSFKKKELETYFVKVSNGDLFKFGKATIFLNNKTENDNKKFENSICNNEKCLNNVEYEIEIKSKKKKYCCKACFEKIDKSKIEKI